MLLSTQTHIYTHIYVLNNQHKSIRDPYLILSLFKNCCKSVHL